MIGIVVLLINPGVRFIVRRQRLELGDKTDCLDPGTASTTGPFADLANDLTRPYSMPRRRMQQLRFVVLSSIVGTREEMDP
jgi:hypothetical protein